MNLVSTGHTLAQLQRMIATGDLSLVVQIANRLLEDRTELLGEVAALRREKEGLEELLRGLQPPNGHLEDVGGSAGLRTHRDRAEAHDEASGLPPDILIGLRTVEAIRTCAEQLNAAADRLFHTAARALAERDPR